MTLIEAVAREDEVVSHDVAVCVVARTPELAELAVFEGVLTASAIPHFCADVYSLGCLPLASSYGTRANASILTTADHAVDALAALTAAATSAAYEPLIDEEPFIRDDNTSLPDLELTVVDDPDGQPSVTRAVRDKLQYTRRWWLTRLAVLSGQPLAAVPAAKRRGYIGPWAFNLAQSAASASIAAAVLAVATFYMRPTPTPAMFAGGILSNFGFPSEADDLAGKIETMLHAAVWPFALAIIARAIGWSAVRTVDVTPERSRRASHAFLYLDGAFGFGPQTGVAIGIGLRDSYMWGVTDENFEPFARFVLWVGVVLILVCGSRQLWLNRFTIPRMIMRSVGYPDRPIYAWLARGPAGEPYLRFVVVHWSMTVLFLTLIGAALTVLSITTAAVVFYLRA